MRNGKKCNRTASVWRESRKHTFGGNTGCCCCCCNIKRLPKESNHQIQIDCCSISRDRKHLETKREQLMRYRATSRKFLSRRAMAAAMERKLNYMIPMGDVVAVYPYAPERTHKPMAHLSISRLVRGDVRFSHEKWLPYPNRVGKSVKRWISLISFRGKKLK